MANLGTRFCSGLPQAATKKKEKKNACVCVLEKDERKHPEH
jgi:hypothetical protein